MDAITRDNIASIDRSRWVLGRYVPELTPVADSAQRRALEIAAREIQLIIQHRELVRFSVDHAAELTCIWRCKLVAAIRLVAAVARRMASADPEISALEYPRGDAPVGVLTLAGHVLADVVARHQPAFRRAGLPIGTGPRLTYLAGKFRDAAARKSDLGRLTRFDSTALDAAIGRGRAAIAVLDTLMCDQFADCPVVLAAWKAAKRVNGAAAASPLLTRCA